MSKLISLLTLFMNGLQASSCEYMARQSPIDLPAEADFDAAHTITSEASFAQNYGHASRDRTTTIHGASVQFDLEDEGLHFQTSITKQWYPDDEFFFTPVQFHFHQGVDHVHEANMGSEHTLAGRHLDAELHLVSLNKDERTQDKFRAAVTGVLFEVDEEMREPSFGDKFLQKLLTTEEDLDLRSELLDHLDFDLRYTYRGSLTTPPYSELLLWTVLPTVVRIQPSSLALLHLQHGHDPAVGSSNRDTQPLNNREIFKVDLHSHRQGWSLKDVVSSSLQGLSGHSPKAMLAYHMAVMPIAVI